MESKAHEDRYLRAARLIFEQVAEILDARISVRLWDGSVVPLGEDADPDCGISIKGPGVLGTILRRPSLENILLQYATGGIDYHGGDLITFYEKARERGGRSKGKSSRQLKKRLRKGRIIRAGMPLLFAPKDHAPVMRYSGDDTGRKQDERDEKAFIQFHYDVSNEFYALFLDPEMQYSSAYFTDWGNSLEQAQQDKLEMICRKLRLQPGDRFLDIGCGWGGLLCHAAQKYRVRGHGVTLSRKQYDFARAKVRRLGLEDRVKIELRNYNELNEKFDKISSIGMYEHIGIANYFAYFSKLRSLLRRGGILLNHGITRRAKRSGRRFKRITPGRRLILKYIFPGSELDHIGHTLEVMEACNLEVHDVEAWREHYALTTRLWCQRLESNREKAVALVGEERFRMWLAYLAGVSLSFDDGSLRIFQAVATRPRGRRGRSGMPSTRAYLYDKG